MSKRNCELNNESNKKKRTVEEIEIADALIKLGSFIRNNHIIDKIKLFSNKYKFMIKFNDGNNLELLKITSMEIQHFSVFIRNYSVYFKTETNTKPTKQIIACLINEFYKINYDSNYLEYCKIKIFILNSIAFIKKNIAKDEDQQNYYNILTTKFLETIDIIKKNNNDVINFIINNDSILNSFLTNTCNMIIFFNLMIYKIKKCTECNDLTISLLNCALIFIKFNKSHSDKTNLYKVLLNTIIEVFYNTNINKFNKGLILLKFIDELLYDLKYFDIKSINLREKLYPIVKSIKFDNSLNYFFKNIILI